VSPVYNIAKAKAGFTLIELLVVVAIIAILAAIAAPAIQRAMVSANFSKATANMRSLAGAVQTYAADNQGTFPRMRGRGNDWNRQYLWVTSIAPYLGMSNVQIGTKIFLNPLEAIHGSLADFGCNSYVLVQDRGNSAVEAMKISQIKQPSKTILLSMARERRGAGLGGTWYMESQTFVQMGTNSPSAKPSDLDFGRISFVNVDGSSSTLPWEEFVERREELLDPQKAK
jgi:prepilin-type N-terminal cleavage/methylation domain-containing protein